MVRLGIKTGLQDKKRLVWTRDLEINHQGISHNMGFRYLIFHTLKRLFYS